MPRCSVRRALPLLPALLAAALFPAAVAASPATDLAAALAVVEQQIVTGAGVHHVVMWPSETEGYVDREGGEKADFALTMANYLPKDVSPANVNVQIGKGLRHRGTGPGAAVGFRTPTGDVTIDTATIPFAQGRMGTTDAGLAEYAAFPRETVEDRLQDLRFLGERLGLRAGGVGSRSALVYDHTDGRGWDVYTWRAAVGASDTDISIALSPDRLLTDYSCTTAGPVTLGKRDLADRDNLLETIVCNGTPTSRTNVSLSGCAADATTLCLQNGLFEAKVNWQDFQGHTGQGHQTTLSNESGDFWYFSNGNNELIIKVIDATAQFGNYWVFWKALSNVKFDMTVRKTDTNQTVSYHNPLGFIPGGHLDIDTIFKSDGTGAPSRSFNTQTDLPANGTPHITEYNDPSIIGPCVEDGDRAKCFENRYRVTSTWQAFDGRTGDGHIIKKSDQSWYVWFFSPGNYELLGKNINGPDNRWIFVTGATNAGATSTVADTATGNVYVQPNPLGENFATSLDISTILTSAASTTEASSLVPFAAPADTTLEGALETIHDRMTVTTNADGTFATVPEGLVVASPDFAGRISGAELYGIRAEWGPNGFGSTGGGLMKYVREAVTGATLRVLPSDSGVGYALALDNNVTTLDPSAAHEYVRVTFDGKTVSNEPAGVRYVTGFTTDAALMAALKTVYDGGVATPQQVQSLMLIPHTTRTMACANSLFTQDCDEYSGTTVSLQPGSTEDLQVSARFKNGAYLDIHNDETYNGSSLERRLYNEEGHFSISTFGAVQTRPALADYGQFSNANPGFFALSLFGDSNGGTLFPPEGSTGQLYSSILPGAPADWSTPLLLFE